MASPHDHDGWNRNKRSFYHPHNVDTQVADYLNPHPGPVPMDAQVNDYLNHPLGVDHMPMDTQVNDYLNPPPMDTQVAEYLAPGPGGLSLDDNFNNLHVDTAGLSSPTGA